MSIVMRPALDTLGIIAWLCLFGNPFFTKFTAGFRLTGGKKRNRGSGTLPIFRTGPECKLGGRRAVPADNALRTALVKYHPLGILDRSLASARRMEFGKLGFVWQSKRRMSLRTSAHTGVAIPHKFPECPGDCHVGHSPPRNDVHCFGASKALPNPCFSAPFRWRERGWKFSFRILAICAKTGSAFRTVCLLKKWKGFQYNIADNLLS